MSSSSSIPILGDSNYVPWARAVTDALEEAGVWVYVDTGVVAPTAVTASSSSDARKEYREHHANEGKALAIIRKHLTPANRQLIDGIKISKDAWDKLKTTYSSQESDSQYSLFTALQDVYQRPNEELSDYHQRIRLAADELTNSFKSGTTVADVVEAFAAFISIDNMEDSDSKESFRQLLTMAGGTSLTMSGLANHYRSEGNRLRREAKKQEKVKAAVEAARIAAAQEEALAAARPRQASTPASGGKGKLPPCTHCKKTTHKPEDCWSKFPERKPA